MRHSFLFFSHAFFFFFFFFSLKKLNDADLVNQMNALLENISVYVKAAKSSNKKLGIQPFAWRMVKQPYVFRVTLPKEVSEFGTTFELWSDGKESVIGNLMKAPVDDDEEVVFLAEKAAEITQLQKLTQTIWDKGQDA